MVELVEPKPLIGTRGVVVLFLGFLLALIVVWLGAIAVQGERALAACMMDRHPPTLTAVDFTFFPPSYDCLYLKSQNSSQVIGRTRYAP